MRQRKQPQQRRNEIIQAARDLFQQHGYENTTVDQILRQTGLSKGGFYHYFQSKDDVLIAIVNALVDDVVSQCQRLADRSDLNALAKLNAFVAQSYNTKLPHADMLGMVAKGRQQSQVLYRYFHTVWERYVPPLLRIVEQGIAEGVMNVTYPEETVRVLLRTLPVVYTIDPRHIDTRDQVLRHLHAIEQLIVRTLGMHDNTTICFATEELVDVVLQLRSEVP